MESTDNSPSADPYKWAGRIGDNWAREFMRTDRSFAGLTTVLVDRTVALSPGRLLDIGCGAGETSISVGRAASGIEVLGIDLSEALIEAARHRGRPLKNVRFAVADASSWHDASFAPDTLMSRHGVMFFADPVAAFDSLRTSARRGTQLIFSCFRDRSENSWAADVGNLVGGITQMGDPRAPGPFAFADKRYLTSILASAGWDQIAFEPVDWDYIAGGGENPIDDAVGFFKSIGPAASAIAEIRGDEREALLSDLATLCARNMHNGNVAFKASAWIVTARAQ